jgi:hypothetical protein
VRCGPHCSADRRLAAHQVFADIHEWRAMAAPKPEPNSRGPQAGRVVRAAGPAGGRSAQQLNKIKCYGCSRMIMVVVVIGRPGKNRIVKSRSSGLTGLAFSLSRRRNITTFRR